jgi:hypothetical protein
MTVAGMLPQSSEGTRREATVGPARVARSLAEFFGLPQSVQDGAWRELHREIELERERAGDE